MRGALLWRDEDLDEAGLGEVEALADIAFADDVLPGLEQDRRNGDVLVDIPVDEVAPARHQPGPGTRCYSWGLEAGAFSPRSQPSMASMPTR